MESKNPDPPAQGHNTSIDAASKATGQPSVRTLEGNPISDYRWFALLASVPGNLMLEAMRALLRPTLTVHDVEGLDAIPDNAICYLFHPEMIHAVATVDLWQRYMNGGTHPGYYLGFHGLASYVGALPFAARGVRALRFDRRSPQKPFQQIIQHLIHNPGRFFIRTDAGGPYGRVRGSLLGLSAATGRPLVPMRQFASRSVKIWGHHFALPGAVITTRIGSVISPSDLQALPDADALVKLQSAIDSLAP